MRLALGNYNSDSISNTWITGKFERMLGALRAVFGRKEQPAGGLGPEMLLPDVPLYIVGDVHGCAELLQEAFALIDSHQKEHGLPDSEIIFLGDYVDRGPQSADVLKTLYHRQQADPDRMVCLMGNHEKMLLEFVDDPVDRGSRWLLNGGDETLVSYGVDRLNSKSDTEDMMDAGEAMEAAMPSGLMAWLRALPLTYRSGNIVCTHAGMDPHLTPEDQSDKALLWGHREFMSRAREDGLWVAHGHTIVPEAHCNSSRIAVDTGAYRTGTLTVAAIAKGSCTFLQTG